MANQHVNKVIIGNEVKIDLTGDDITAEKLAAGIKAHDLSLIHIWKAMYEKYGIEVTEI